MAENYVGSVWHRARINQMGTPFVKPLANQTAVLGRPFTLNCTYGGYPLEEVYFVKGSGKSAKRMPFDERHLVPMMGSVTINPVERADQDHYRCVVVTSTGQQAEQSFYLHVVGRGSVYEGELSRSLTLLFVQWRPSSVRLSSPTISRKGCEAQQSAP